MSIDQLEAPTMSGQNNGSLAEVYNWSILVDQNKCWTLTMRGKPHVNALDLQLDIK